MSARTKEQRAIAAAHLCDLFAHALRSGDMYDSTAAISLIVADDRAEEFYRYGLGCYGVSPVDIDAAVAAIARGEHPPTSLPGRIKEYKRKAKREAESVANSYREHHCDGEVKALGHVLALLGCEVPK